MPIYLIIIISVLAFLLVLFLLTFILYNFIFGKRFEIEDSSVLPELSDFPSLSVKKTEFPSNKGQILKGSFYENKNNLSPKGLIIISHGIFGGHQDYLAHINIFAQNGFMVFGYDNTGCHYSGGKGMTGLPQSMIDLNYALKYIDNLKQDLPIFLFGHSWGGFAVSSVFNFTTPKIQGVLVQSGFNRSSDLVIEEGSRMIGGFVKFLSPFIKIIEHLKYGKSSGYTAKNGILNALKMGTKFFIIHSKDDKTISLNHSVYYNAPQNKDVKFLLLKNKGHNSLHSDDSIKYKAMLDKKCIEIYGTKRVPSECRAEFFKDLDRDLYLQLDEELMNKIVDFFKV